MDSVCEDAFFRTRTHCDMQSSRVIVRKPLNVPILPRDATGKVLVGSLGGEIESPNRPLA